MLFGEIDRGTLFELNLEGTSYVPHYLRGTWVKVAEKKYLPTGLFYNAKRPGEYIRTATVAYINANDDVVIKEANDDKQ